VLQPGRFPMKHITVEGDLQNAHPSQVREAISQAAISRNILIIDIARAAAAAQELPWVDNVQIERQWPDTLVVYVNERVIRSRWNDDLWLDQAGNSVELAGFQDTSLPQLRGVAGSEQQVLAQYQNWQNLLKPHGLMIAELNKSGRDSWEMIVSDIPDPTGSLRADVSQADGSEADGEQLAGKTLISIKLGSVQPQSKLEQFIDLYDRSFGSVSSHIERIDMRYQDGISIEWKDAQPKEFNGLVKTNKS